MPFSFFLSHSPLVSFSVTILPFHPALGMPISLCRKRKQRSENEAKNEKRENCMNCCSPKWLMLGLLDSDLLSAVLGYMSFLFRLWRQKVGAINDDRVVLSILWRCIFFAEAWTNQRSRSFSDQTLLRQTRRFFGKLRVFWVNSQAFPRSKADVLSILNLGVFKNLCRYFWTLHGGWRLESN